MSDFFDFDVVGVLEGTDKSSAVTYSWDYLRKYQEYFWRLRDQEFNLLEIGVLGGASLKAWKAFFPRARIVGIDINPRCLQFVEDRVAIEIGSQDDPEFLARVAALYPPTIVIDDGSHQAHHIVFTFERLYSSVLPGGYYVVEDLNFHSGDRALRWKGLGSVNPIDYFDMYFRLRAGKCLPSGDSNWGFQKYVHSTTDSIIAIDSALIFQKRGARPPVEAVEAFAQAYLGANTLDENARLRLAKFMARHYAGTPQAEKAMRQAMSIDAPDLATASSFADLLLAQGNLKEAEQVYAKVTKCFPDDAAAWASLGTVRRRLHDLAGSEAALAKAIALDARNGGHHFQMSKTMEQAARLQEALSFAENAVRLASDERTKAEHQRQRDGLQARRVAPR